MRRLAPITSALMIGACLYGLWTQLPELTYGFQGEARDLGTSPQADSLRAGQHVRLSGTVLTSTTADYQGPGDAEPARRHVVLLADAPVAVLLREGAAAEEPGRTMSASGRLHRADQLGSPYAGNGWQPVATARGLPLDGLWVLHDGQEPATPWKPLAWSSLLVVMLAFSAWRLYRLFFAARNRSSE